MKAREAAGETAETQVISIKKATLAEASMTGRDAVVSVEFVTEQVNVVRDAEGKVVDGDPNLIDTLTDVWTFRITSYNVCYTKLLRAWVKSSVTPASVIGREAPPAVPPDAARSYR